MKEVTVAVGNEQQVQKAFEGAHIVFAVTDSWAHFDFDREVAEGKLLIDAAIASSIKLFIWSALPSLSALTNGKYSQCMYYDTKGVITEHLQSSGLPHSLGIYAPRKQSDGSYLLALPMSAKSTMAWFDTPIDYGLYVRAAIESPAMGPGSELLCGRETTWEEVVSVLSRVTGKEVKYQQIGKDDFLELFKETGKVAPMLYDMFMAFETAGFYGPKNIKESQQKAGIQPRTFAEIAESWKGDLLA